MAGDENQRSGVAATMRLTALTLTFVVCIAAARGAEKYKATPIGATAADKIADTATATRKVQGNMTVGDKYTLNVTCRGIAKSYDGKLLKVTDHWIVLRQYNAVIGTPLTARLGKIPVVGSWIRHAGETPGEVDRWFPREAVAVASHRKATNPVTIREPLGKEPPIDRGGRVELVRGGKVVSTNSDLAAVSGDKLTLLSHDDSGSHRESVARRDILCIAYIGRCLDPKEAE
jgi:hypothetical protein